MVPGYRQAGVNIHAKTGEIMSAVAKKKDDRDFIREALSFTLGLPWEALGRFGIKRSMETEYHPGQTIVMYPPFEALSVDFDERELFDRVRNINDGPLSIYLHVPFCTGICTYCSYARSARGQSEVMKAYVDALIRQRDEWVAGFGIRPDSVDTVFIGGGTPTSLEEKLLLKIVESMPRSEHCEMSVETDPDMATAAGGAHKLAALRRAGANRISMGVETFDDHLAKAIGRRGHERVHQAFDTIRGAGFDDINIDLMYGLPNQSLDSWLETLRMSVEMDVPSITLYGYKLKRGSVDWKRPRPQSPELEYERKVVVMQKMAELYLCSHGYKVVIGKWFVKTKKTFRQQTRKYQNSTLLGFGPSTYSFVGNSQLVAQSNTQKYITSVNNGMPVIERGRHLFGEELAHRRFVFGLKTGFDWIKALDEAPPRTAGRIRSMVEDLSAAGLIDIEDGRAILSDVGRLFADEICRQFYSPIIDAELIELERVEALPLLRQVASAP